MFKSEIIVPAYKNLLGWKQYHDTNEFQIDSALTTTETGEYFQQKHPALALNYIQTLIPSSLELDDYLEGVVRDSSNEIFNDLIQYRQLNQYGKTLLEQSTLLNKYGWKNDLLVNKNRFVGFQIRVKAMSGLQLLINQVGLQFAGAESFKMYLFHSSQSIPLKEIDVTTDGNTSWKWNPADLELNAFDIDTVGGVFILGYYQEDIVSNAINYSNFNWDVGECSSCNHDYSKIWKSIRNHYHIYPIYVAQGNFVKGEMFDLDDAFYINNESFGMNLRMSVRCDLTTFFIQNKFVFKNLLGLKVVHKVLEMMKFSQEINAIEENIKMMIIRDLEGDVDTKLMNIPTRYHKELKSVAFNIESINKKCLGCSDDGYAPTIGQV